MKELAVLVLALVIPMICTEEITPFKIATSTKDLEYLKQRLENARYPDAIENLQWEQGTNINYLRSFVDYWKNEFNWTKQENLLNQYDQFVTDIDGLKIHFVHVKSKHAHAKPLMLIHGWPGSFFECYKVIPLLVDPEAHGLSADQAFHVVCPSLPGYGFSGKPTKVGWDAKRTATAFATLMKRLDYSSYTVQGGDWGSMVAIYVAHVDKEHCAFLHLNLHTSFPLFSGLWKGTKVLFYMVFSFLLPEGDQVALQNQKKFLYQAWNESGYLHIQGTRPQTVGYGLNDSPVGLAAYILEKFYKWSDCRGNLESTFTKDELLTNIMIYWLTGSITSSMRYYFENMNSPDVQDFRSLYIEQPTGYADFPAEVIRPVEKFLHYSFNLVHFTRFSEGGHFAALEQPQHLVRHIREFHQIAEEQQKKKVEL